MLGSRRPAPQHSAPQHFSHDLAPVTLTLTKLSVVEQAVTGAQFLGHVVLGQDVGEFRAISPYFCRTTFSLVIKNPP